MWYKIAKFGYIDVKKYIEDQIGYELNFEVDDYLKYMINQSSYTFENNMFIDFDKLNTQLQNSPFNSLISRFGSIKEIEDDEAGYALGAYVPSTKSMYIIPTFPKFALSRIVEVLLHEFAHALDPGNQKREPQKEYTMKGIMRLLPLVVDNLKKYRDRENRILSREEIWNVLVSVITSKSFNPIMYKIMPKDLKNKLLEQTKETLKDNKEKMIDHLLAILGNKITDKENAEDFLMKQYFNLNDERPAQLLSVHLATEPKKLLEFCMDSLLGFILSTRPTVLEELGLDTKTASSGDIIKVINAQNPGFINDSVKNNFISIVRRELFEDIQNSDILRDVKNFILYVRNKKIKRQAYTILSDNFNEFKKLVDTI